MVALYNYELVIFILCNCKFVSYIKFVIEFDNYSIAHSQKQFEEILAYDPCLVLNVSYSYYIAIVVAN